MSSYVVWMDFKEAKLFNLVPNESKRHQMKLHAHAHASHTGHGGENHTDADKWFHQLAEALKKDAKEVLIMGPGEAKKSFKHYLENKYASTLGKAVIGVESVDHPTEPQLLEKARHFFKHYDLFH